MPLCASLHRASTPAPGGRWCRSRCRICARPAGPRANIKRQRPCQCALHWVLMGDADLDADAGVGGAFLALSARLRLRHPASHYKRAANLFHSCQAASSTWTARQASDKSQAGGVVARTSMMRPLVFCSGKHAPAAQSVVAPSTAGIGSVLIVQDRAARECRTAWLRAGLSKLSGSAVGLHVKPLLPSQS